MTVQEWTSILGDVGGFIGSVAVLITLVYLAIQVKQAKHQIVLVGHQARASHAAAVLDPIVRPSELSSVFAKLDFINYGEYGLTAEETVRFGAWCHIWFQAEQGSFYMLPPGSHDSLLTWMLATPAGAEFWKKNKGVYDLPFAEHVDELYARLMSAPKTGEDVLAGT